jgi:hypothetical protein
MTTQDSESPGRRSKGAKLLLRVRERGTMVSLVAGSQQQLREGYELAVAEFGVAVTPTLYQSRLDALRRARICARALRAAGEFR